MTLLRKSDETQVVVDCGTTIDDRARPNLLKQAQNCIGVAKTVCGKILQDWPWLAIYFYIISEVFSGKFSLKKYYFDSVPLLGNNTKLVKFRHSSAFIVGKITTCGSHVYDRPEFRQIFQRWIQRTTQSPNNPETQNPGQQQHGPQEEEGFLLFFLVSTSRHCPPPLGHWGGAASESPAGESRGSLRAPRKYVTAAVSWILLTEATDKTRTFWSNLSHPGSGRNNPRTQSLVLFHEMEIGTRYQKPTDEKCNSFL